MAPKSNKIDFLSLPHRFQKAIANKCSLVTWSRLMRTSEHLDRIHGRTNQVLHLRDDRTLWFVDLKDSCFLSKSFSAVRPLQTRPPNGLLFAEKRPFKSLIIHVPRICIAVTAKMYCPIVYSRISKLQYRADVLHIFEFPKSELEYFSIFIHVTQADCIYTDRDFATQKSLLAIPIVSQLTKLYLPNNRIDGKLFMALRSSTIEVNSTNISHIVILRWLKEIQSSERVIHYVKLTHLSTYKRNAILKKFSGFTNHRWRIPSYVCHATGCVPEANSNCQYFQCFGFISSKNVPYNIMEDVFQETLCIGSAAVFQPNNKETFCSCMSRIGGVQIL